jgi:hypothetical protein
MGYLDKSTITVDAILTNRGRELLSQGTGTGNFQITKFAVSDDEVDYGLYNTAHPLGSNYYGSIIENMPVLEATPDETQIMRYKLVSITGEDLTRFGSIVIPQIQIQGTAIPSNGIVSLYFSPTSGQTTITIRPTTTFTSTVSETESSYTLLLADSTLATVEVKTPATGVIQANNRGSISANGLEFTITALNKTGSTSVTIFGGTSGAVYNFTLSTTASA